MMFHSIWCITAVDASHHSNLSGTEIVVIAIAAMAVIAVTTIIILFINLYPSLNNQHYRTGPPETQGVSDSIDSGMSISSITCPGGDWKCPPGQYLSVEYCHVLSGWFSLERRYWQRQLFACKTPENCPPWSENTPFDAKNVFATIIRGKLETIVKRDAMSTASGRCFDEQHIRKRCCLVKALRQERWVWTIFWKWRTSVRHFRV